MSILSERIAELLEERGMSQRDLAKAMGINEVSVSRYVHDQREPNSTILSRMTDALHTTPDYLLGKEKEEDIWSEYYKIHGLIKKNAARMSMGQKKELINALLEEN